MSRIEFTPIIKEKRNQVPSAPVVEPPSSVSYVRLASKAEAERRLFDFLASLYAGQPQAREPLVVEAELFGALCQSPHKEWQRALAYCVNASLLEISPELSYWGKWRAMPVMWALVWLLHNCFVPASSQVGQEEALSEFNEALLALIPPARTLPEMLLYDAILQHGGQSLPYLGATEAKLLQALLIRSPLSALSHLDLHTPPALTPLAAKLLRGGRRYLEPFSPWQQPDEWLDGVALLVREPRVARFLRQRWLTLPAEPAACRNLGLLLEALRRREHHRAVILEFYEAYCYRFGKQNWPLLAQIERLLTFNHPDSEIEMRFRRTGNERYLNFYALLQLVKDEQGVPREYKHLTLDFYLQLEALARFASVGEKGGFG